MSDFELKIKVTSYTYYLNITNYILKTVHVALFVSQSIKKFNSIVNSYHFNSFIL